jgi:hypothetical protein
MKDGGTIESTNFKKCKPEEVRKIKVIRKVEIKEIRISNIKSMPPKQMVMLMQLFLIENPPIPSYLFRIHGHPILSRDLQNFIQ